MRRIFNEGKYFDTGGEEKKENIQGRKLLGKGAEKKNEERKGGKYSENDNNWKIKMLGEGKGGKHSEGERRKKKYREKRRKIFREAK